MIRNKNNISINFKEISDEECLKEINNEKDRVNRSLFNSLPKDVNFQAPAIVFKEKIFSYQQLYENIDLMARKLYTLGFKFDSKVILILPNSPQTIYTIYALNKIGCQQFINFLETTTYELEEVIKKTKPDYIITDITRVDLCSYFQGKIPIYITNSLNDYSKKEKLEIIDQKGPNFISKIHSSIYIDNAAPYPGHIIVNDDCEKDSIFLGSGGTTGSPKTIVLNDRAINLVASYSSYILRKRKVDIINTSMMTLLPFFHAFGFAIGLHAPLFNRATISLFINFDTDEIIKKIKLNWVNYAVVVPYIVKELMNNPRFKTKDIRYLTHVFIGGNRTEFNIMSEFDRIMKQYSSNGKILEGYGMTETVAINSVNRANEQKYLSVGKPLPFTKIKIFDKNEKEITEKNYTGEIYIHTESFMKGYLEEVTDNYIYTDENGDRYLKTGDNGYFDDDGYLYLVGRIKDIYKIAGINIYPQQIITVAKSFNEVKDAVTKLFRDGLDKKIYLYIEVEAHINKERIAEDIKIKLANTLNKYYQPYKIVVKNKFERNLIGKINVQNLTRE